MKGHPHPRRDSPVRPARAALGFPRPGRLLRPQQSSVPGVRLQGPEDRPLRHLLLPGRRAGRRSMASRMAERWYTRLSQLLDHQLSARQPLILYASGVAFPPDQRHRGRARRGHRRRHRSLQAPHRPAVCRPDRRRPTTCSATSSCTRSSTTSPAPTSARARPAPWRSRCGSSKGMAEYLSIRPGRSAHGDVDARRDAPREAARRRQARQPEVLPVPLRPGALGLHRRQIRRRRRRQHVARRGGPRCDLRHSHQGGAADRLRRSCRTDWHNAEFEAFRPIAEATKMPASFARPLITSDKQRGELNVGPELSPDGSRIIYLLRARPVLDRPLRGRRQDRQGHQEDHQHRDQLALREPVVPDLGGRLGSGGQAVRLPRPRQGRARPDDCRRRPRQDRARDPAEGSERDPQPGVVARRQADRVLRARSAASPICSSTTWQDRQGRPTRCGASRPTPLPRSTRRGRPTARRSRSAPIASRPISRPSRPASCASRSMDIATGAVRSSADSTTPRTSARSGRPTAGRSISFPTGRASRTSTAWKSPAARRRS